MRRLCSSGPPESTDVLVDQAKKAIELLVRQLDRADAEHGRTLFPKNPSGVYEACLVVLMRLVFLRCAGAHRRSSTDNADRFLHLGTFSNLLTIDDRTVSSLMTAIETIERENESPILSCRAPTIEQIGYVYENLLEYTVVEGENSLIVVPGPDRRRTGAHYTPKSLADEIVDMALKPAVYDGLSDGKTVEDCRLKKPHEILSLKICDPAMGCGIFLLEACRWLGARLVESWNAEERNGLRIDALGRAVKKLDETQPMTVEPDDRLIEAMRLVAAHCLYGVDINPMAVEIAKHSIRLLTLSTGRQLDVLDQRLRSGDALLGLPLKNDVTPTRCVVETQADSPASSTISFHWPIEFPEVFADNGGFDVILGNPPFLGGRKMRGAFGKDYLEQLLVLWPHGSLNSDYCAFFFLRAAMLLRNGGSLCFLATNTIGQGDTARTGLLHLIDREGFSIHQARSSFAWPGKATVMTSMVALRKGNWLGKKILDGREVSKITAVLDDGDDWGNARVFPENAEINFQGSVFAGKGFVLTEQEANDFLAARRSNEQIIFPFLGGDDLNTSPTFAASRWAIDFRNISLERCENDWPELLERIRRLVKPERDRAARAAHRRFWWQHGDKRPALYDRIRKNEHVFALVRHTKHLALARVTTRQVFQESLCLLDLPNWGAFAVIQSTIHYLWARRGSSTLGEGLRYTPSDYFDTFPFLHLNLSALEDIGEAYYEHRTKTMLEHGIGLTKIYNRLHSPEKKDRRTVELRDLRRRMDEAVAAAYGWSDLPLEHGFHLIGNLSTNDRIRFLIGEKARTEILRRLSTLNREI